MQESNQEPCRPQMRRKERAGQATRMCVGKGVKTASLNAWDLRSSNDWRCAGRGLEGEKPYIAGRRCDLPGDCEVRNRNRDDGEGDGNAVRLPFARCAAI